MSFLTIGIIWVNHQTLLEHVRRVDRWFLYLNLLLLLSVAVVPFPTAVVGEYIQDARGATAAPVRYGLVGLLIAITVASIFFYATPDGRLVRDAEAGRRIRSEGRLFPIGLAASVVGIALAVVSPLASLAVYGVTALFYALPLLPLGSER